jgi:hypothetical protein
LTPSTRSGVSSARFERGGHRYEEGNQEDDIGNRYDNGNGFLKVTTIVAPHQTPPRTPKDL